MAAHAATNDFACGNKGVGPGMRRDDDAGGTAPCVNVNGGWYKSFFWASPVMLAGISHVGAPARERGARDR